MCGKSPVSVPQCCCCLLFFFFLQEGTLPLKGSFQLVLLLLSVWPLIAGASPPETTHFAFDILLLIKILPEVCDKFSDDT